MPEDHEEFISLTLRTMNSKKSFRILARNWKHQWLPQCIARQARTVSMWRLVVNPMISSQNLRVSWKPVNPQECIWKNLYQIENNKNCGNCASNKIKSKLACILEASESTRLRVGESLPNHHDDHIATKGDNSLQHYNLVHKFIPMPQAMKIPAAKAVDKEWWELEKISA